SDQHLDLSNPSIFYPVHGLAGAVDISGVTFPGAPGIVLGRNPTLAWGSTVVAHDALDVYSETRVDCPESDAGSLGCVTFNGESVALEFVTETIFVGEAGTPTRAPIVVQYPIVPHHGPLIPDVRGGEIVGFQDLSVRYTGYQASQELRALSKLWTAETIDEGFTALGDFVFGGQNWVFADTSGNIGWTTHAEIPVRAPLAYTFNPQTGQGAAPFLVLPGDGSAGNFEWVGAMSARYIPHVINPASGYIATANQDPVGETFDGNALDGPVVDSDDNPDTADTPLYLGHGYAAGYRNARIVELIEEAASAGEVTADQMAAAQLDTLSVTGRVFQPFLVTALSFVEDTTGAPMDVVTLVGGLEEGESDSLVDARDRIEAWTLATPAAFEVLGSGETTALSPEMIADSVATSIFNAWLVAFLDGVLGDEFSGAGLSRGIISSRTQMSILERAVFAPDTLANGVLIATGQATICDNLNELGDQSCTAVALEAMLRALGVLEDPQTGFGTNARDMWRWGDIHRVDLDPLAPSARLTLPAPTDPDPATRGIGFPRSGDNFNINRTDPGIGDFNFEHTNSGPAQRFVAELSSAGIRVRLQIPGGTVFNRQSPFYRNLMDDYWQPGEYFDVPHTLAEIQESAVERHLFR
ncbi:MAG: penicillin acylase family protein, partial [Myxococcota bacterium]